MGKQGYNLKIAAEITAAASVIGPNIPPSGIMNIYACVKGESEAALFLAGFVSGIIVGLGKIIMVEFMADKCEFPVASLKNIWPKRGKTPSKRSFL